MTNFEVEELRLSSDLEEILLLDQASFDTPFTKENFIFDPQAIFLGIKSIGALVAYCYLHDSYDEVELYRIAVKKEYQRQGLATKLMLAIKEMLHSSNRYRRVLLEVRYNNEEAVNLYRKVGFKEFAFREGYYSNGDSAYLMEYVKEDVQ